MNIIYANDPTPPEETVRDLLASGITEFMNPQTGRVYKARTPYRLPDNRSWARVTCMNTSVMSNGVWDGYCQIPVSTPAVPVSLELIVKPYVATDA